MNGFIDNDLLINSSLRKTMIIVFEENRLEDGSQFESQSIETSLAKDL